MAGSEGLSSQDLRARAQVAGLRRSNNGHREEDPIEAALGLQRKLAAQKIVERSLSETNAAAIEAENQRLKAQIENQKLTDAMSQQSESRGGDSWREYLLAQMDKLQTQLDDSQRALTEQQMGAMSERLQLLADELNRVQSQQQTSPSGAAAIRQSVADAKELIELLGPSSSVPPPVPSGDPALQAWVLRAQLDQQRWQAEREDRHAERMAELSAEAARRDRELGLQEQRNQRMDRFLTDTAPRLLDVGMKLMDRFSVGRAAPVVAPAVAPQIAPPAGALQGQCQQCGGGIFYKPTWTEVICQRCGAEYALSQAADGAAPPAARAPQSPQQPARPVPETTEEEE